LASLVSTGDGDGEAFASLVSTGAVVGAGRTTGEGEGVVFGFLAGLGVVDEACCGGASSESTNDSRSAFFEDCRVSNSEDSWAGGDGVGAAGSVAFVTIWRLI
jgi:hypothetical protein